MTTPDALPTVVSERPAMAGRRTLAGTLVGGLLIAAIEFAATRGTVDYSVTEQLGWLLRLAVHWTLAALPVGLAIAVLERRSLGRAASATEYVLAALLGAGVGAGVLALHGKYVDPAISVTAVGLDMALADRFLYGFWQLSFWGAVGAALHATNQRQTRGEIALRGVELARLRSERSLSELRLAALQAQVEPEFLLATLRTVERLCATDPPAADRVLDALIRFLREASPVLRNQVSTVAQECRLLQNYLRVLDAARDASETSRFEIDPRTSHTVMPPGTLLSLAQPLLGTAHCDGRDALVGVRAAASADAVTVDVSTAARHPNRSVLHEFVARAEQRLRITCGPRCSIQILRDDSCGLTLRLILTSHRENGHDGTSGY